MERRQTWRIWIDTGGTFTDCLAIDPATPDRQLRVKVLSSSALRATVTAFEEASEGEGGEGATAVRLRYAAPFELPAGFADGATVHRLGADATPWRVASSSLGVLELEASGGQALEPGTRLEPGQAFELRFDEEAPILAARLVTGAATLDALPPLALRLATTRGTNALLERQGARTMLFVTRGFKDLLRIGDQRRPDLFALAIERPEPLYADVVEVPARRDAQGAVLKALDLAALENALERAAGDFESAAIALIHSYLEPADEVAIEAELRRRGLDHVSSSAALSPTEGYLARTRTAVVDAYLAPVIGRYLERIRRAIGTSMSSSGPSKVGTLNAGSTGAGASRVKVMTSAGGLVGAGGYRAKDSLLSGPAGGVVGAATAARRLGFEQLVAFDMGGTSTDVSRYDGDFDYRFEHRVGDAEIAAPALAIETVAAGGGSICRLEGRQLKVGPASAGADPGPACYGAGGPLTLTDVNLLLGRLDEERFEIPLDRGAAEAALEAQARTLGTLSREELMLGYVAIADQRMADAVRQISVRRGYDPRGYALVAFGGAGGQHACAVAEQIGIETVILPPHAGLLSAFGLGSAVLERFSTQQVSMRLEALDDLPARLDALAAEALAELEAEAGGAASAAEVRRRLAYLRLAGQESTLEIEIRGEPDVGALAEAFLDAYAARYGYRPDGRPIELESLRVVASERRETESAEALEGEPFDAAPVTTRPVLFAGERLEAGLFWLPEIDDGARFLGPALLFDRHASLTLPPGWRAERRGGAIIARRGDARRDRVEGESPVSGS